MMDANCMTMGKWFMPLCVLPMATALGLQPHAPVHFFCKHGIRHFREKINADPDALSGIKEPGGRAAELKDRDPGDPVFRDLQFPGFYFGRTGLRHIYRFPAGSGSI